MKAERQQKEATSRVLQQSKGGGSHIVDNRPAGVLQGEIINYIHQKKSNAFKSVQRAVNINYYGAGRPAFPQKDAANLANYPNPINVPGRGNVDMTKHHVVPWRKLKIFVRDAVLAGHVPQLQNVLQGSANIMINQSPLIGGVRMQGASTLASVTNEINAAAIINAEDQEAVCAALCWTPGNLFIGPSDRSDDPGEQFETNAANAVGAGRYPTLMNLNTHLDNYHNNRNIANINAIVADFVLVHVWGNPVAFNNANWVQDPNNMKWHL